MKSILVLLALMMGASFYYLNTQQAELAALNDEIDSQSAEISEAQEAKEAIDQYQTSFESLKSAGFIGKEKRLLWVERLESSASHLGLTGLTYSVGPQKQVGNHYESVMSLSVELLHELDLITLLNELGRPPAGFMSVNSCRISKINTVDTNNFKASCEISWHSVRMASNIL